MPRVVFRDSSGQVVDLEDLEGYTGPISYEILWGHEPDPRALRLHGMGRQHGSNGEYSKALDCFARAHDEDPEWPYPLYDAAYTYLLMGDADAAERHYSMVDSLAPEGFFTAKTALDCLRRERGSLLESGTYLAMVGLEFLADTAKKRRALESILERNPTCAFAWSKLVDVLPQNEEKLRAIERGLACEPDPETRGQLLLNRSLILANTGGVDEAIEILTTLARDESTTISNRALAEIVLRGISRKKQAGD